MDVHKHAARGISWVCDEDIILGAAVESVDYPGIDGTEGEGSACVRICDFGLVLDEPEEFADGWVSGEGKAANVLQLVGAETVFESADQSLSAGVSPDDGVVEGFACLGVPDYGCLALVGDADCFDGACGMAVVFEEFDGPFDACLN